jgi:hypothetical protein
MAGLAPEKGSRREAQGTVPRNRRQHRGMPRRLRENRHAIAPAILRPRLGLRQGPRNRPERVSGANDRRRLPIFLAMGRLSHCRPIAEARPRMPDAPPGAWGRVAGSHGPTPICARGAEAQGEGTGQGACRSGDGARLHGTEPRVWQTRRDARERKGGAASHGRGNPAPVSPAGRFRSQGLVRVDDDLS